MFSRKERPTNKPRTPENTSGAPGVSDNGRDGGYNAGIAVFSYIVGGILVWSLIGWGLDISVGNPLDCARRRPAGSRGRVLSFSYARPHQPG